MTHEDLILKALPTTSLLWVTTGELQARIWQAGFERLSRHNLALTLRRLREAGRIEKRSAGRHCEYRRT